METEGLEPRVTLDPNLNPNPGTATATATATATDPVPALVPDPTATTVTTEISHYIIQLWYKRLGHLNLRILRKTAKVTKGILPTLNKEFEYKAYI
jgi:hypothetical protein